MRFRVHYAWIVAAVTFVVLLITAGVRATPGLLMVPLEAEFGWNRAVISGAVAINIALFGLIGPFAASVMDRWGLRRVILARRGACRPVGGPDHVDETRVAADAALGDSRRNGHRRHVDGARGDRASRAGSKQRRGVVLGALSAANATGQLVFLPLLAGVVERRGWRSAALIVAGAAVVVFGLVAVFMRDRPQDVGLLPVRSARR